MPRHDLTYAPSIRRTSSAFSSKSFQALNWVLPVSSARTPEKTAFGLPSTSTSLRSTERIRAVTATFGPPSRRSTTRTGVGWPTSGWPGPDLNSGSASGAFFPTAVRTPKFTWTWPRYSFVYAFWTRTTSPLARGIGSGSHAVKGTVAVGSPRMPDRIVFVSCPWGVTSFSYTATTRARRFTPPAPFETVVDTDELCRAVVEFLRIWREQAASRVPTSWGTIYRDERFAAIHQANLGWVASIPEEGSAKILADLDEAFRDSPVRHRSLLFEDAEEAYGVQEDMARQGFRPVADLAMAKVGLPACIVNPDVEIRRAEEGAAADDFRVLKIAADAALGYTPQVVGELWGVWHDRSGRGGSP